MTLLLLVEGRPDEAMGRRLATEYGFTVYGVYGKGGWQSVQKLAPTFARTAEFAPCLSLVDLMDVRPSSDCPASIVSAWVPDRHPNMMLRVVVRELESWLMADRQNIAELLAVPISRIPLQPEQEPDPKQTLIGIAKRSRSTRVKAALVPRDGPTAPVGPDYNTVMERFVLTRWNPTLARKHAPSLDKCLTRLEELRARLAGSP